MIVEVVGVVVSAVVVLLLLVLAAVVVESAYISCNLTLSLFLAKLNSLLMACNSLFIELLLNNGCIKQFEKISKALGKY